LGLTRETAGSSIGVKLDRGLEPNRWPECFVLVLHQRP
jgi:hypothetical protein